ncbi:MAG: DNA internalization-related competence protein ComEC/Rec2 [Oscillospiraceae bacterium]|nr:DNA internalization-related competence protein ComEC/Rec2 [Oscillospiraceae bacterium]
MRKLMTAAFSFTAAIFIAHHFLPYNWPLICAAIAAAASPLGLLFYGNKRIRVFIIFLTFAVGFAWSWAFTTLFIAPSWHFHEENASVTAVVTDFPTKRATRGYRVDVVIRQEGTPNIGARLFYFNETDLGPGDVIKFTANFRRTDGPDGEQRMDSLSARGAFLTAFASGNIEIVGSEGALRFFPKRLADTIANMIGRLFPEDVSHFMQALLVGRRDGLFRDTALNASLSAAGIIHVVSISGMHVSFLMSFLALIVKNKRLFSVVGIPVLLLFMAMTGFTPSVTRAGIMQVFLICAPIFKRERDSITSLSASLIVLLAANPYSIASVGLQLSFSATLGIILLTTRINAGIAEALRSNKFYKKKAPRAVLNFVTSSLATTVGALVPTIPLTAYHFGYVSLIAPLSNLLTLWAVSLAFPIGLVAAMLGFVFYPLGTIVAFPVTFAARYIITIARSLASVPYSIIYSSNTLIMFWLAYIYVVFIALPLLKARARQYICPACLSAALLFIIILITPFMPGMGGTSITVLDIGQGLSVMITSGEHTAIVDCGSLSGENAGAIAHEYLVGSGRTKIDIMILTHFHADHVNGVEFLFSRIYVSALAIPERDGSSIAENIIELARSRGTDIIYVTEVVSVSFGELSLTLFPPVGFGDENERGLTILTQGEISMLITGDMNSSSERALLRMYDIPDIDVLIAGHHGSRHSTSNELLAAVTPEIAIISVGRNSFGHPAGEVIERLENHSVIIYRTDLMGHVRIRR